MLSWGPAVPARSLALSRIIMSLISMPASAFCLCESTRVGVKCRALTNAGAESTRHGSSGLCSLFSEGFTRGTSRCSTATFQPRSLWSLIRDGPGAAFNYSTAPLLGWRITLQPLRSSVLSNRGYTALRWGLQTQQGCLRKDALCAAINASLLNSAIDPGPLCPH